MGVTRELRSGWTTGTCAAVAAKAATMALLGLEVPAKVGVILPSGDEVLLPVIYVERRDDIRAVWAAVRKDGGDDPDATDGLIVEAAVAICDSGDIRFIAGDGVGTVTKPGLAIPPGEPAINPVPRMMIRAAVRAITNLPVVVTVAIPGGSKIAAQTFNPRLGIKGGLSVLGTTGVVRPFSLQAVRCSLNCALDIAIAAGVRAPVYAPGNIGARAARQYLHLASEQLVEVGNEWGYMLDRAAEHRLDRLLVAGHPGKLAKLAAGWWDTHSSRSQSATPVVRSLAERLLQRELAADLPTTEGLFAALEPAEQLCVGTALAGNIQSAVGARVGYKFDIAVMLVNLAGKPIATAGDLTTWS